MPNKPANHRWRPRSIPTHNPNNPDPRKTRSKRGYDNAWMRCRNMFITMHPLCSICLENSKYTPATVVHHIIPISEGGKRLDPANLTSLCRECHERLHGRLG